MTDTSPLDNLSEFAQFEFTVDEETKQVYRNSQTTTDNPIAVVSSTPKTQSGAVRNIETVVSNAGPYFFAFRKTT